MKTAAELKQDMDLKNITCLRRLAISIIKSKKISSVAQKMRQLSFNTRAVLDYLKISKKSHSMLKPETLKS
jgi:hypothetical protein